MRPTFRRHRPALLLLAPFLVFLSPGQGATEPLSKSFEVDFGRETLSRNLKGLAARSDGRLLPGPEFIDLEGPKIADILWTLEATADGRFLVGTGPEGRVHEITFDAKTRTYTTRPVVTVTETQAMAVHPLPQGGFLIGTSPKAAVYLAGGDKILARVPLPGDSVFDFLALPDGTVLAATGNPGKIYRIDPVTLAKAGVLEGNATDEKDLPARGVTLFAEIRDRNVRRLALLSDGRVAAGSSPKGTVYAFAPPAPLPAGSAPVPASPVILFEQREAEIVDLLPTGDGGVYAAVVTSPGDGNRITPPRATALTPPKEEPDDRNKPAFSGRSTVVKIPATGFSETVLLRNNIAFYRLAASGDWLVIAAGEQGDTFGYDPAARRSLVFAGSASAQLSDLAPLGDGSFLTLRNNAPGLALLSFASAQQRQLETRRMDLGQPSELGNLRLDRLRGLTTAQVRLDVRTSNGSDEIEGWSEWTELRPRDGAFFAPDLRGRYLKLRLTLLNPPADFQIDKATLFHLPQNNRPQLADFRIFPPNVGILPAGEQPPSPVNTIGQWLSPATNRDEAADRRKNPFLSSQVVPAPGTQLVYWSVTDQNGDTLAFTFSIRPESSDTWIDLAVDTRATFCQFEVTNLVEGVYLTRLKVDELAPRPAGQRLTYDFETDALLVDRTPPRLSGTTAAWQGDTLILRARATDTLSLLEGVEFNLNNGVKEAVTQPLDGIRDGREEEFGLEVPSVRAAGATSVEIIAYDQAGNATSVRVPLPSR